MLSDDLARPSFLPFHGFVLRERYSRIECEEPGYEGLIAEVRTNLTHAERDDLIVGRDRLDQEVRDRIKGTGEKAVAIDKAVNESRSDKERTLARKRRDAFIAEQAAFGTEIRQKRFALFAPYVRWWNVFDDDHNEVPPPAVDPESAFKWIDDTISFWLLRTCDEGYLGGGKGVRSSKLSGDAPAPTNGQPTESDAES